MSKSPKLGLVGTLSSWNRARLVRRHASAQYHLEGYRSWLKGGHDLSARQRELLGERLARTGSENRFEVLLNAVGRPVSDLQRTSKSLERQIFSAWHCTVFTPHEVRGTASQGAKASGTPGTTAHQRVQGGPLRCGAVSQALSGCTATHVVLSNAGDLCSPVALAAFDAQIKAMPALRLVYADDDEIDQRGRRHQPRFKPQLNRFMLRSGNYMGGFLCIERQLLLEVLSQTGATDEWCVHDIVLRILEKVGDAQVCRIPLILSHRFTAAPQWLQKAERSAPDGDLARSALAVRKHLVRLNVPASVEAGSEFVDVRYPLPAAAPRVSIVIPSRDKADLLASCVASVLRKNSYPDFEILLVDNGTEDPRALALLKEYSQDPRFQVIHDNSPFNYSALNNRAVQQARGDIVCLMNNDVQVLQDDWLETLVAVLVQPGVGAVGARLLYPDGRLQHAGVIVGLGGIAGHPFRYQDPENSHYMNRSRVCQELSAVTAAVLVIHKDVFLQVGGLDEVDLKVAFNDVDLCLKVRAAGRRVVYEPHATLVHHESVSRGLDDSSEKKARFDFECEVMKRRWKSVMADDPAYNPSLTTAGESYAIADRARTSAAEFFHLEGELPCRT